MHPLAAHSLAASNAADCSIAGEPQEVTAPRLPDWQFAAVPSQPQHVARRPHLLGKCMVPHVSILANGRHKPGNHSLEV